MGSVSRLRARAGLGNEVRIAARKVVAIAIGAAQVGREVQTGRPT